MDRLPRARLQIAGYSVAVMMRRVSAMVLVILMRVPSPPRSRGHTSARSRTERSTANNRRRPRATSAG
ncbi:MAG: hypothetical protein DLM60_18705 [Pseudonocardiales bacterium]|nr:hypothetical protein [Actinomycetota bacterium]PZS14698.1 MAG: hypothetical protein DLM60_18705 [Pseudonocardiales bacterium]